MKDAGLHDYFLGSQGRLTPSGEGEMEEVEEEVSKHEEWPTHCIHGVSVIAAKPCIECLVAGGAKRSKSGRFLQRLRRYAFRLLPLPIQIRILNRELRK